MSEFIEKFRLEGGKKVNYTFYFDFRYDTLHIENVTIDDESYPILLSKVIVKLEDEYKYDMYEEIDDEGVEYTKPFIVDGKFYEAELFCKAEWCGDFSSRRNLPGEIDVIKILEIVDYEIKEQNEDVIIFEAKKYKEIYNVNN